METWTRDGRERPLTLTVSGPGIAPRTTSWLRDVKGRVTKVTYPDGLFDEWTYNTYGQPLTHRLRNGAVETMTYSASGLLTESRDAVQASVVGGLPAVDRGVKQARFAVIRHTRCAAVLVEGGFINNPAQARAISKPDYRDRFATAIAEGVSAYQRGRVMEAHRPGFAQAK